MKAKIIQVITIFIAFFPSISRSESIHITHYENTIDEEIWVINIYEDYVVRDDIEEEFDQEFLDGIKSHAERGGMPVLFIFHVPKGKSGIAERMAITLSQANASKLRYTVTMVYDSDSTIKRGAEVKFVH